MKITTVLSLFVLSAEATQSAPQQTTHAQQQLNNLKSSKPPAYTPIATPAPNQDEVLRSKGFYQTTVYKCQTRRDGDEKCGWYTPILKAEARRELSMGVVLGTVSGAALIFVLGLL
ncbi:uncharacterized protein F5Z01DRAFT_673001 [Emericellopsis atlantica]|uniref:Uncharacterized protein n=1 Tax=Emericellopsis atlantica TaxID=2614577 RepID=A0A9P7ZPB1_9HYPO|nr:uncharacterized protein F5Z01DRAFT_673001 [Emericellopsis atlantica]KAG9255700.1 hypothetical protein F5Z01DRAFT_673001 [Emericellopsis atlantica]